MRRKKMINILAFTLTITQSFIGWTALIFLIVGVLLYIFAVRYKKCDDWVTPFYIAGAGIISVIIGVVFGVLWLGSVLF